MDEVFREFSKRTKTAALAVLKALCDEMGLDDQAAVDPAAVDALWTLEMVKELHARVVALETAQQHPPGDGPQDRSPG